MKFLYIKKMDFIKGRRAGLAIAVAGFGIGLAMFIDAFLAEKKFREHKVAYETSMQAAEEGIEHYTKRSARKRKVPEEPVDSEYEVVGEDEDGSPLKTLTEILNENDEEVIRSQQEDERRMLPGESYADWYERVSQLSERRNPLHGVDLTYTGDGSDASKKLYFMKKAYLEAKYEKLENEANG